MPAQKAAFWSFWHYATFFENSVFWMFTVKEKTVFESQGYPIWGFLALYDEYGASQKLTF